MMRIPGRHCEYALLPEGTAILARLLDSLHAPFFPSEGLIALETLAMRVLRRVEPKILIIDEAHDLLAGSYRDQRCAFNLLKGLANDLKIPVVAVGTEDARHAIQTDPHVASRFDPLHLARWKESDAFRSFVAAFGKLLPLRKASAFGQREMVRLLFQHHALKLRVDAFPPPLHSCYNNASGVIGRVRTRLPVAL